MTEAGVGLQAILRELRKQGLRPLAVGAIGEFAIANITMGLPFGAYAGWASSKPDIWCWMLRGRFPPGARFLAARNL